MIWPRLFCPDNNNTKTIHRNRKTIKEKGQDNCKKRRQTNKLKDLTICNL